MLANFISTSSDGGNPANSAESSGQNSQQKIGRTTYIIGNDGDVREQKETELQNKPIQQAAYSMPGALHYIQHEWSRYEMERAQWEMERTELKARISFLIGERKSQENLKNDLVRRIKMLEYALKQERAKMHSVTNSTDQLQNGEQIKHESDEQQNTFPAAVPGFKSAVPLDIDAIPKPGEVNKQQEWANAREMLRQYLQEIGYTEKILEVRSFRVKQLLGVLPPNKQSETDGSKENIGENLSKLGGADRAILDNEQLILEAADAIRQTRMTGTAAEKSPGNKKSDEDDSDSSSGGDGEADLDADAVEAFGEFAFLKNAIDGSGTKGKPAKQPQQQVKEKESLDVMKERLKSEQERRRQQSKQSGGKEELQGTVTTKFVSPSKPRNISVDAVHGIPPNTAMQQQQQLAEVNFEENVTATAFEDEAEEALQLRWNIHYTLRTHYDSVRAMQFHPVEHILITASEDGTAKLWDLNHSSVAGAKNGNNAGDGSAKAQPATGIVDIEPVYTFRGHSGPILALDMSSTGENCYTAGLDGTICCWNVPSTTGIDIYQNFDPKLLQERLHGHTDAIWSLCFHSSSNRLISASADGTIRIWIVGLADGAMPSPLLKTITELAIPRSIDLVSTESHQLLSACSGAQCHVLDFETGQTVVQFQMHKNGDDSPPGEINKILSHPTMPVTITAGEDRKINFFDNNTGKLINSTIAHVEGVSTLAIDPNGLYLLSGSHDGSVRLWNAEKRICLQEIAAHRKKQGSGVMAVAFHPSRQLIGSAGADSLAKVYGIVRSSPRSSLVASASPPSSSGSSGPSSLVGSPQKHQAPQHIASSQL